MRVEVSYTDQDGNQAKQVFADVQRVDVHTPLDFIAVVPNGDDWQLVRSALSPEQGINMAQRGTDTAGDE